MSHSDPRELQAFALVAGAVAGSKTSACNLETAAMPGVASGLQALQAPHVGGRMQGRGRLSAGGGGQGRRAVRGEGLPLDVQQHGAPG
jgi:hypothetical protein